MIKIYGNKMAIFLFVCLKMFGQSLYRSDSTGIKRFTTEMNLTSIYYLVEEKCFYCSVIF